MSEEEPKPPVQYVLVRKDLPIFTQMVHVAHAASEGVLEAPVDKRTVIRLLHVANEMELITYHDRLVAKDYHVALVREPDFPYGGQAMSLATAPLSVRTGWLSKLFWPLEAAK